MNGQHGRQRAAKKHGLFGCKKKKKEICVSSMINP